jgi:hypothetical protein
MMWTIPGISPLHGKRTVIAGILGDPAEWARAEQEAREAFEEEIRTLHENVVLLDDYRNRTDDHRETL